MRRLPVVLCVGLALFATSVGTPADAVVGLAPAGSVGYDVSWPQCNSTPPSGGAFGIVGVTGGTAFSSNPCLQTEFTAFGASRPTGLYVNTGNPGPSSPNWPTGGAYDYGWNAGANAIATAQAADVPVSGRTWWLDVETGNSWSSTDYAANTADLQGEMAALLAAGVQQVGIYSTGRQWQQITGGAATAPLTTAPLWIAGATEANAAAACAQSFTGAPAALVQYTDQTTKLDADLVCPAPAPPPPSVAGAPRNLIAKSAKKHGVTLSWAAPASNGGAAVTGYRVYRGTVGGRLAPYQTVPCTGTTCSWTDTGAKHRKRYYYRIAAVNAAGTGPTSTWVTAKGH